MGVSLKPTNVPVQLATDVEPIAPLAVGKGAKNETNLIAEGTAIISMMSEEEKAFLGSKSHTLHFVRLLGLKSKPRPRVVEGKRSIDSFTPCGIVLVSDEDISVPVIETAKNMSDIPNADEIGSKQVKAKEEFVLNLVEFMYLVIREEYSSVLEAKGNPKGCYLSVKTQGIEKSGKGLPTPTVNFAKGLGSPKEDMLPVDMEENDKWVIQPEYAEKFGILMTKSVVRTGRTGTSAKSTILTPHKSSAALRKMLGNI